MAQLTPTPPAHDESRVPIYKLYGYGNIWQVPDPLYCETIAAQKKLHNWHVTMHQHLDLFQVLYLGSGQVTARLDDGDHTLGAGHVVVVPQRVAHEYQFRRDSGGFILTLTYALLRELCERFELGFCALGEPFILRLGPDDASRHAAATFHRLNSEYRAPHGPQRGPLLESLLAVILVWIFRSISPEPQADALADPGARHLDRYARLIDEHYATQHEVAWYASRIGVTSAHLNSVCKRMSGKSSLQLIHERLLLEARRKLIYTRRHVGLISDDLGFSEPGYFTRFFKRMAGVSPRDFRKHMARDGKTPIGDLSSP